MRRKPNTCQWDEFSGQEERNDKVVEKVGGLGERKRKRKKKRTRALNINQGLEIAKELGIRDVEARLAENLLESSGLHRGEPFVRETCSAIRGLQNGYVRE
jgi:hypothetical protein